MAMGGIARVSQVQLLQPFITFALAAFFNDETITPQILLFAVAVVATVAISTRTRSREAPLAQG
jgi:drug/metabolite transporter (DMT)-like permease